MKKITILILVLILSTCILMVIGFGCTEDNEFALNADADSPENIAEKFLNYCISGNKESAKSLMIDVSDVSSDLYDILYFLEDEGYISCTTKAGEISESKTYGPEVLIPATLNDEYSSIDFKIYMTVQDGEWKVNGNDAYSSMYGAWHDDLMTPDYSTSSGTTSGNAYSDGYDDGYRKGKDEFEHALENMTRSRPRIDPGTGGYTTSADISAYVDGFWDGYEAGVEAAADAEDASNW